MEECKMNLLEFVEQSLAKGIPYFPYRYIYDLDKFLED